uniref:Uncharacterized protein n=1 Tax=Candidatus Kentrum sp. LPFa TaxID=2126335 RepID=A0A450W3A8_9GAMM|nr:MAG: hypothetical protein BECKLPF1236A_GA0070988_100569 [Candidatus Kentron sp. LPFa]VFK27670.1 MAG: hypothetical protein BECKLPF1236C_GA0070990_100509 [Candidatus Kentron sp. LPFa]
MLLDNLQPDISISRDELVSLPWRAQSICELTVRRALAEFVSQQHIREPGLLNHDGNQPKRPILLGDMFLDELLTNKEMWPKEKIFSDGENQFSVMDLRSDPSQTVTLRLPYWFRTAKDFSSILQAFLARYWLKTIVQYRYRRDKYPNTVIVIASGGRSSRIKEAEKLFPPLFFAEYEWEHSGEILPERKNIPYRIDHPFSQWLLEHAVSLRHNYPGIFGQIRDALLVDVWAITTKDTNKQFKRSIKIINKSIRRINQSLQRAGKLNPEMKSRPNRRF